jgi:hypothetical protein
MLYAALAGRAGQGQKKVPSRGTRHDVATISTYLLYSYANVDDNEFVQLMEEKGIHASFHLPLYAVVRPFWCDSRFPTVFGSSQTGKRH